MRNVMIMTKSQAMGEILNERSKTIMYVLEDLKSHLIFERSAQRAKYLMKIKISVWLEKKSSLLPMLPLLVGLLVWLLLQVLLLTQLLLLQVVLVEVEC